MHSRDITGVPAEVQLQVMSYLTPGNIRNLMINRVLRPVCEQCLYESISVSKHIERSLRLLETFVARPDLALLVRHLSLDMTWHWKYKQSQFPSSLQPNPLQALLLAKNIKSFSPYGVSDWVWEPTMCGFRDVVSSMKLVRLEIPSLHDPNTKYICTWPGDNIEVFDWGGDLGQDLRRLFQSQPLLEELVLPTSGITCKTVDSLRTNLKESDIPNLKFLEAGPGEVTAFLPVAPRLERLSITLNDWGEGMLSTVATALTDARLSIRDFSIRVWLDEDDSTWIWTNLDRVFGLFPNTESLYVTVNALTSDPNVKSASYHFSKVAINVHVLPLLRNVTVKYEAWDPAKPGIFDVEIESVQAFKSACPILKSVIDPMRRLWTFREDSYGAKEYRLNPAKNLMKEYRGYWRDLPAPAGRCA
ncbi:hypothetical protein FRB90_009279 [Tulasnella sp. 427]|nr:hypothetical protein FRB90_009279 [Tulasnella sp. 427]